MQNKATELIARAIHEEDEIKQKIFLELKENANDLEADIFNGFIELNKDYKNDDPDEKSYVVYYEAINLKDTSSIQNEEIVEKAEYYKYLGFKDILWIKGTEKNYIILKDDIYNFLFENDPIYASFHNNTLSVQILKEEYFRIMNETRIAEHKKYNAMAYTYLKVIRDKK